jgi:hypothetical protein
MEVVKKDYIREDLNRGAIRITWRRVKKDPPRAGLLSSYQAVWVSGLPGNGANQFIAGQLRAGKNHRRIEGIEDDRLLLGHGVGGCAKVSGRCRVLVGIGLHLLGAFIAPGIARAFFRCDLGCGGKTA